jgi:hypothetical protein
MTVVTIPKRKEQIKINSNYKQARSLLFHKLAASHNGARYWLLGRLLIPFPGIPRYGQDVTSGPATYLAATKPLAKQQDARASEIREMSFETIFSTAPPRASAAHVCPMSPQRVRIVTARCDIVAQIEICATKRNQMRM